MGTSEDMLERAAAYGPIQIWTFAFDGNRFKGEILPELDRLKEADVIRLIDLLVVRKDGAGRVATLTASDLDWEEATSFGAMIGGLIGLGFAGEEGAVPVGALAADELAPGDDDDCPRPRALRGGHPPRRVVRSGVTRTRRLCTAGSATARPSRSTSPSWRRSASLAPRPRPSSTASRRRG